MKSKMIAVLICSTILIGPNFNVADGVNANILIKIGSVPVLFTDQSGYPFAGNSGTQMPFGTMLEGADADPDRQEQIAIAIQEAHAK